MVSGRQCLGDSFTINGIYKRLFKDDSKEIQGCNAKGQ